MNIVKTGFLSSVATAAKLISAFVIIKLVALFSGPEGVAQFGQFMSVTALLVVLAGGGIGPGIVKYVAEYKDRQAIFTEFINSAMSYTLITSVVMFMVVIIFSEKISILLMGSSQYESLIIVLAFCQIFVAVHNFIVAIINGMMDVRRLALIHVSGAIMGLLITAYLGYLFKLYGVLLAYLLSQSFLLFLSLYFFKCSSYFSWSVFRPHIDKEHMKNISKFSVMVLVSAILAPVVQIIVRNYLAGEFSWEDVGYWQAVSKVSEAYLLFITMAISVYYLPKLSMITYKNELILEIKNAYLYLIPLVILSASIIYLLREFVTYLLFSSEFTGAHYLYAPQLIGDVLKIASFILSYIMLAKAMTKTFIFSEILFSILYVIWVYVLTSYFGLIGAMYAFAVNYAFYLIFIACITILFASKMPEDSQCTSV